MADHGDLGCELSKLLEGAILLAMDELVNARPERALNVLLAARTTTGLYNRARAAADVEALKRAAMAIEGEYP